MDKLLVVVDMQVDFVTGSLGSPEAQKIVPRVVEKVKQALENKNTVAYTMDTHKENYLETFEGQNLPVEHCIDGTGGWELIPELNGLLHEKHQFKKPTFGSLALVSEYQNGCFSEVELCGVCTDICVVSNALLLRAALPETRIVVDSLATAGSSREAHAAALLVMQKNQIDVIYHEDPKEVAA